MECLKKVDDLGFLQPKECKIGDTIFLVRKISNHLLETKLIAFSLGEIPQVEVEWSKSSKYQYRINLKENTVHAIDATAKHKQEMRLWYEVWEPHRLLLITLCKENRLKEKRNKKRL